MTLHGDGYDYRRTLRSRYETVKFAFHYLEDLIKYLTYKYLIYISSYPRRTSPKSPKSTQTFFMTKKHIIIKRPTVVLRHHILSGF